MLFRLGMVMAAIGLLQACATAPSEPLMQIPEGCRSEGVLAPVPALRSAGLYALRADLRDGRVIARQVVLLEAPRTNDPPTVRPTADNPFPDRTPRASSLPFRSIERHMATFHCPGIANIEAQLVIGPDVAGYRKVRTTPVVEGEKPKRLVLPR